MGELVGIDPGPHTGFFWNGKGVTLDLTGRVYRHLALWQFLSRHFDATNHFVVEDFEFRKDERSYIDYDAAEFLGVIQLYCQLYDIRYYVQKAAAGKGFWTDDKLKKVGLYGTCDSKHSRDALRHWLHHYTFNIGIQHYMYLLK